MPNGIPMPRFRSWREQQQWAFMHLPLYWQNLRIVPFVVDDVTSEFTPNYNCIAYAAKDDTIPWWPYLRTMPQARYFYWPVEPVWPPNVDNFVEAFETCGFERCKNGKHQFGFEKVAIYVDESGAPQHMARELGDGMWHSKLGGFQDICHHFLVGVEDGCGYGKAKYFLRKRIKEISKWAMFKRSLAIVLRRA